MISRKMPKLAGFCCFSKEKNNRLSWDYGKRKSDTIIPFFFFRTKNFIFFKHWQVLLAENILLSYIIIIIGYWSKPLIV